MVVPLAVHSPEPLLTHLPVVVSVLLHCEQAEIVQECYSPCPTHCTLSPPCDVGPEYMLQPATALWLKSSHLPIPQSDARDSPCVSLTCTCSTQTLAP